MADTAISITCFHGTIYYEGEVVASFPALCLQFVCVLGNIEAVFHGSEYGLNCCVHENQMYGPGDVTYVDCQSVACIDGEWKPTGASPDPNCCLFNGTYYEDGYIMPDICALIFCTGGEWQLTNIISMECDLCEVYDDPHFRDYRNFRFDFHGYCNYALSQPGSGIEPDYGVFAQFEQCWLVTCVQHTTILDIGGTEVVIGLNGLNTPNIYTIEVNGCSFTITSGVITCGGVTYPVMAWKVGSCIRILSSHFLVQHCKRGLTIWVHPTSASNLHGLCGPADNVQANKFIARDDSLYNLVYAAPFNWAQSWQSINQASNYCTGPSGRRRREAPNSYCPEDEMAEYNITCDETISKVTDSSDMSPEEYAGRVFACAMDLCIITSSRRESDIEGWLEEIENMVEEKVSSLKSTVNMTAGNTTGCEYEGASYEVGSIRLIDCEWFVCIGNDGWKLIDGIADPDCDATAP